MVVIPKSLCTRGSPNCPNRAVRCRRIVGCGQICNNFSSYMFPSEENTYVKYSLSVHPYICLLIRKGRDQRFQKIFVDTLLNFLWSYDIDTWKYFTARQISAYSSLLISNILNVLYILSPNVHKPPLFPSCFPIVCPYPSYPLLELWIPLLLFLPLKTSFSLGGKRVFLNQDRALSILRWGKILGKKV